jgi:N,N-dimethylformamidase
MLDAVKAWLDDGGRLMYLGGNGFYWVTSVDPYRPHVVEVRRGIAGTRTWESIPGELRHSTTGEPGGLWRYRGRDPNRLVGIGFAAQGFDERAAGYERCAASYAGPAAWIFEGVEEPVIGEFGLVMEGAAGDEIDRFDPRHGSPPSTTVLATSRGRHTNFVQLVTEDIPVTHPNIGGQQNDDVRADITLMTTGTGGAVFAVGSMSWCGCLSHSAYNNNVARITRNVLDRFRNPIPIESPSESHETAAP